jgi:ATP-dependent exoDNAse (exonuclease V) alpha subunit
MHVSLRVPWHDRGWDGHVCDRPSSNTACLALSRIAENRDDEIENARAGRSFAQLATKEDKAHWPTCLNERGFFMSPEAFASTTNHPYRERARKGSIYLPIAETSLEHPAYAAAGVPFRWMLRRFVDGDRDVRGLVDAFGIEGYDAKREPSEQYDEYGWTKDWVQEFHNQRAMLDTFFSAIQPEHSLCFFYAKRTPLADDRRRVLVGVGRVKRVGEPTEYQYDPSPIMRSTLWERSIFHSIRPEFEDGFVLPYQQILQRLERDGTLRSEDYCAFLPDEHRDAFSYGTEHVTHDVAIAALQSVASTLRKIETVLETVLEGPWARCLRWIEAELARLWKLRGPFPGFGAALQAFGLEHGHLLAMQITQAIAKEDAALRENPWSVFDALLKDPTLLGHECAQWLGKSHEKMWTALSPERRRYLQLLSRFEIAGEQAWQFFNDWSEKDQQRVVENPYILFEESDVPVESVDRGLLPGRAVAEAFPLEEPTALDSAADPRRTRAFVIDELIGLAAQGHTLAPRSWIAERLLEREVEPRLVATAPSLDLAKSTFAELVAISALADGAEAWQYQPYQESGKLIAQTVEGRTATKAARHKEVHDWRALLDEKLGPSKGDATEDSARTEKAAALAEIHASRLSVLIGPAGTGKTTVLQVLSEREDVKNGGVLLLAPTGKARVRLEEKTKLDARTIAQLLLQTGRYDADTGVYAVTRDEKSRLSSWKTVIVDECSMLTQTQLAALFDSLSGVDRFVLVGDPRQLPPIGEGRPFVDIVRRLEPKGMTVPWPRVGRGFAELTVVCRQRAGESKSASRERDDVVLARTFGGGTQDAAIDEVWSRVQGGKSAEVRAVEWKDESDFEAKLLNVLVEELGLQAVGDEGNFGKSYTGVEPFEGRIYPHRGWYADKKHACVAHVANWQVLAPQRVGRFGTDLLNRLVQQRMRPGAVTAASRMKRSVPKPVGEHSIVYGDKVICVRNHQYAAWNREDGRKRQYVANGTLGVVVGEYDKHSPPKRVEVAFESLPAHVVSWSSSALSGDEGDLPIELAYALTVHKAQGSEFGLTLIVMPSASPNLSREMLYTALTRQTGRLVLLHQGPLHDMFEYGSPRRSDVARRLTNVFEPPELVAVEEGSFLDAHLVHRTRRGELVRSKSEVAIADLLLSLGRDYKYEQPLEIGGVRRYPDFTVKDDNSGATFYMEHLGMLDDAGYRARWERKLAWYESVGITPAGGENGTLIVTTESRERGLDMQAIEATLREALGA